MPKPQAVADQSGASSTVFPPAPWRLKGELAGSAWLVPADVLEETACPAGWRPLTLFGRRLVGAIFAHYGGGGDLAYRELAVAVAVRRGFRLAVTVPWIWVDDAAALEGGRALWAIPKEPARFPRLAARLEAEDTEGRLIAALEAGWGLALPGRWRLALRLAQPAADEAALTPARISGRLRLVRAAWRARAPLQALERRPLVSLRLEQARLVFGREAARPVGAPAPGQAGR